LVVAQEESAQIHRFRAGVVDLDPLVVAVVVDAVAVPVAGGIGHDLVEHQPAEAGFGTERHEEECNGCDENRPGHSRLLSL